MKAWRFTCASMLALLLLPACSDGGDDGGDASGDGGAGGHGSGAGGSGGGTQPGPGGAAIPFGAHAFSYAPGTILPAAESQAALDDAVRSYYDGWRDRYLQPGCGDGRFYIASNTEPGNLTVSEAMGYGMLISAIMAGHDPAAQEQFDGLFLFTRDHPSAVSPDLTAWYQDESCESTQGLDSASDGDLDIAFALLLADRQWGSCGAIDYRAEAEQILAAITEHELDESRRYVLLGDWVSPGDATFYNSTRSSDLLLGHFRSFAALPAGAAFGGVLDAGYQLVESLQANHSPATGLLPDFIADPLGAPAPVAPGFLEGDGDGAYSYNACRDPWRIGTDYLVSDDPRARAAVEAINGWIEAETGGDPALIQAGYQLDGQPLPGADYLTMAFVAPFGVAAMSGPEHQAWLDALWSTVAAQPPEGYYEDTVKLLSMIVMSANWWAPDGMADPCARSRP